MTADDVHALVLLSAVRAELIIPARWLQGSAWVAVTADGDPCEPTDPAATKVDLPGAFRRAGGAPLVEATTRAWSALLEATEIVDYQALLNWHETTTHDELIAALDKAIALVAASKGAGS
jgi:hypothetical protein